MKTLGVFCGRTGQGSLVSRLLACCVLPAALFLAARPAAALLLKPQTDANDFVPGEVMVKFKRDASPDQIGEIQKKHGLKEQHYFAQIHVHHFKLPQGMDVKTFLENIKQDPHVEYAEPNFRKHALSCYAYAPAPGSNDVYFYSGCSCTPTVQWGYAIIKADQAAYFYGKTKAYGDPNAGVVIAVLDTGVRPDHPDLQYLSSVTTVAKLLPGASFQSYTASSSDDNFIADGYAIAGHGTHAAGVAAATAGNGIGIAGVAGNCKILPVKVLDDSGSGSNDSIIPAYTWAVDHGAKVLNCSFGGGGYSQAEQDAITYVHNAGALVVAATGNDGVGRVDYPGAYSYVMGVGATDGCDQLTYYSNYGTGVSVVAPGGAADGVCNHDVFSCALTNGANCLPPPFDTDSDYTPLAGTSFSSPQVAGLAGVLFSLKPLASPDDIRKIIEATADPVSGGAAGQWNTQTGYGRINVLKAVGYALGDPTAVLNAVPGGSRAYNFPNPFSPEKNLYTTIAFITATAGDVDIRILDTAGFLVWQKTVPAALVETRWYNFVPWDGKNTQGTKVANGVYFCRISGAGLSVTKKIAVLR